MKLTTITHVSVDGVMQGLGGPDEDRRGGFERGGWALPLFVDEAATSPDRTVVSAHCGSVSVVDATYLGRLFKGPAIGLLSGSGITPQ